MQWIRSRWTCVWCSLSKLNLIQDIVSARFQLKLFRRLQKLGLVLNDGASQRLICSVVLCSITRLRRRNKLRMQRRSLLLRWSHATVCYLKYCLRKGNTLRTDQVFLMHSFLYIWTPKHTSGGDSTDRECKLRALGCSHWRAWRQLALWHLHVPDPLPQTVCPCNLTGLVDNNCQAESSHQFSLSLSTLLTRFFFHTLSYGPNCFIRRS